MADETSGSGLTRRAFLEGAAIGVAAAGCGLVRRDGRAGPFDVPYTRLASDVSTLQPAYDVVVVGSGYGASVLAARLAPGRRVAVLERGREWAPGDFPERTGDLLPALRTAQNPLGLIDLHVNRELDVLVGCGLGGTSLINANVVIEPDPDLFDLPAWPDAIRSDHQAGRFAPLFAAVRDMLGAQRYDRDTFERMARVQAFRSGVDRTGGRFSDALLAINVHRPADEPNAAGTVQQPCTLCGSCVSGCNVSAKSTLNMNYLPLARRGGAEIYTQVEVDHLVQLPSGEWEVRAAHHPGRRRKGAPGRPSDPRRPERVPLAIRARAVVIGAGSLGSTGILLRSRARGLALPDRLGERVSGNADLLGFAYNGDERTNDVGFGTTGRRYADVGATIVSIGDYRKGGLAPIADRFLIEDGAIPKAVVALLRRLAPLLRNEDDFTPETPVQAGLRLARGAIDLGGLRWDPDGALNHSLVFLGMGHDSASGRLVLASNGEVRLEWPGVRREAIFQTMERTMQQVAHAFGAIYVKNPVSRWWLGRKLVTVHPLGGCSMGERGADGVVDHAGRVFSGRGTAVHDGLVVADAAVLPTSVGVNPLLTISALAERMAAEWAARET